MSLELKNIEKRVGADVHIHDTSLTLADDGFNILLGTTLSGKTTLMQLMAGIDRPTSGEIWFNGTDVTGVPVQKRNVSMVYQQFINYPNFSVYENIASPLRVARMPATEIDRRVHEAAELMKLTPMLKRRPSELSGGQQQRTAMARALVKDADLILFDEPLANLDYKLREELRVEIPRIFEASGAIFVYATTEPEEALLLGGNTATLWEGRVTQFGPTAQVYRRPVDATTARVFSDPPMNFLQVSKTGARLMFGDGQSAPVSGRLADLPDGRYTAGFRPNHLEIRRHSAEALRFTARLSVTELTGSETFVHLDHHGEPWVGVVHGVHDLPLGEEIPVWLDPRHVYIFGAGGELIVPAAYALAA